MNAAAVVPSSPGDASPGESHEAVRPRGFRASECLSVSEVFRRCMEDNWTLEPDPMAPQCNLLISPDRSTRLRLRRKGSHYLAAPVQDLAALRCPQEP